MLSESELWWCTEYAAEIHDVLRKREYDRFSFEFKAPQIEWRTHIIQYLWDVAQKLKLAQTTLHLAVYYLDIFMDNHTIRFWRLYLVALTSLRIAAKIEEKDFTLIKVEELNASVSYTNGDYNILESIMLKLFDWDMNIPTAATFGSYYAEFVADENDFKNNIRKMYQSFEHFKTDMKSEVIRLVDRSIFDVSLQHKMLPSKLAAMCLAATRYKRNIEPVWPLNLEKLTQIPWDSIKFEFGQLLTISIKPRVQLEAELDEIINQESKDEFD